MGHKETKISDEIVKELRDYGCVLFRYQNGRFRSLDGKRIVHVGQAGIHDYVGYTIIEITPDMVGKKIAVFTSAEFKSKTGVKREGQKLFKNAIDRAGGISFFAKKIDDALDALKSYKLCPPYKSKKFIKNSLQE